MNPEKELHKMCFHLKNSRIELFNPRIFLSLIYIVRREYTCTQIETPLKVDIGDEHKAPIIYIFMYIHLNPFKTGICRISGLYTM